MFSLTATAQQRKITAESNAQSVLVFSSGAQVQRTASLSLQSGRTEITFTGLSNQLEQQSLQLKADAAITLLSVQTTKDFFGERKIETEERTLIDLRNTIKDKLDIDIKLLDVYKNEEAMLIKNQSIGGQGGVKTAELKEALDLQRQRLTEVYQRQLDVQKRIAAQQHELEKVRAQISVISKKRDSVAYSVIALVESKESRSVTFHLLYTIKDAGWYPTYDVRVTDIAKPLQVLMNANVFQRSGESWKDISLQLSTGNPGDNATPSILQSWKLGFYDPSAVWMLSQTLQPSTAAGRIINENGEPIAGASVFIKGSRTSTSTDVNGFFKLQNFTQNSIAVVSMVGFNSKEFLLKPGYFTVQLKAIASNLSEVVVVGYGKAKDDMLEGNVAGLSVANARRQKEEELQTVAVDVQYQPTATVYKIEDKYTLETDGKTTTIAIKNFDVPAQYHYYSAPKIDASVFLTAKVVNWQDYDLQSGEANLYFEGTFLGKTYIDLATTPDTLSLSLGKDNSIKINRKLANEFNAKKLIGSNRTETKQYEITIRNTKRTAVTVLVQDQYPLSIDKEIDVQEIKAPEAQLDRETGIASWIITLQPGQEKKLQMGYSVKYPKDKKVVL
jgi:hypothetical protein